jgi:hypothetical protein
MTAQHGLHTVVVGSNVVRAESHPFYEGIGYQRTATSHTYRKDRDRPSCGPTLS